MAPGGRKRIGEVLTPLELEIMKVLWDAGPGTAAEVKRRLPTELAYNTVQTMLQVLLRKKRVERVLEGRAYRYIAVTSREGASRSALADLVTRMFEGSGESLLMALVDTRQITPRDISRAAALIEQARKDDEEEDVT